MMEKRLVFLHENIGDSLNIKEIKCTFMVIEKLKD